MSVHIDAVDTVGSAAGEDRATFISQRQEDAGIAGSDHEDVLTRDSIQALAQPFRGYERRLRVFLGEFVQWFGLDQEPVCLSMIGGDPDEMIV